MNVTLESWEHRLISLAQEAIKKRNVEVHLPDSSEHSLAQSYSVCARITSEYSRSFSLASSFLPFKKRMAVHALYAFCRTTDDIVDSGGADAAEKLETWREISLASNPPSHDPVALAWAHTRATYAISTRAAAQLIDGVARDLFQQRYDTFADLATYAYGVASTVGLMFMNIVGFDGQQAIPFAVRTGVALQLTNILRDVGEDWENGRCYLPQQELKAYGLSEKDIARGKVNDKWREFMKFQIERVRCLYQKGKPGIAMIAPEGRLALTAAVEFYSRILDDIEAHDYDVFNRRAHLSGWKKLRLLPGMYFRAYGAVNNQPVRAECCHEEGVLR